MVNNIVKYIITKPTVIQIAKDEVWENTWNIDPNRDLTQIEIQKYLESSPYKSIAIESIFKEKTGFYVFGMIFREGMKVTSDDQFIDTFYRVNHEYTDFATFIERMNKEIIGKNALFVDDPDKIRIGVVNHWFSVGPCLVWEKGQPKTMTVAELDNRLSKNPNVMSTELNYQGMSFVYNLTDSSMEPVHWMKSPCSDYDGKNWTVNKDLVIRYLQDWQGIKLEK